MNARARGHKLLLQWQMHDDTTVFMWDIVAGNWRLYARYEDETAMLMNIKVFWNVTPCRLENSR
jgi:hypothetical protein